MSTTPQVETVSTGAEKAKLAAVAVLVIGSIAAFYVLGQQDMWLRVLVLLIGLAAAVGVFFISDAGKQVIAYGRDSVREVKKVVWPTRKEAMQMTAYVFGFVVIMAIFLFAVDTSIGYIIQWLTKRG